MDEAAFVWCGEVMVSPHRMGARLLGQQKWVYKEDLGARSKLETLVGALMECCFSTEHLYLVIGAQVESLAGVGLKHLHL